MNILIIEDEQQACHELEACIQDTEDMQICACTNNVTDALQLTRKYLPDVVILDLELHLNGGGGNGIEYLSALQKTRLKRRPFIVLTTNNTSQIVLASARKYGADMILTKYEKNYSAAYVIKTLCLMKDTIQSSLTPDSMPSAGSPAETEHNLRIFLQRQFDYVGINPKHKGYRYLIDAVIMLYDDPSISIKHELGRKYHVRSETAERAMQNAIKNAWNSADPQDLQVHYTAHVDPERGCPTLMEFIYYYLNHVKNM